VAAFERMGAHVVVDARGENLVRSRRHDEGHRRAFVVEAQGLANLLHEFVHAVMFGCLADDHGIDYGQIPFDLSRPEHRRILWDELACCVVSCAYVAHVTKPGEQLAVADAWFADQIAIQHVFYGDEEQYAFVARVEECVRAHEVELEHTILRAYANVSDALSNVTIGGRSVCDSIVRHTFGELWSRFRANGLLMPTTVGLANG